MIAYLDGNAGISGNMFLGALLDLGMPFEYLQEKLSNLPFEMPKLTFEQVKRKGIGAKLFEVELEQHTHADNHEADHHHRHLEEIIWIIEQANLPSMVQSKAIECFKILAAAEAEVHQVSANEIHFHEVGAVDAIIDIVGTCLGFDYLGIEKLIVSPLRVGFGTVHCAHGEIALPAPATMKLLEGYQVFGGEYSGEWTTPTGAALVRTFATEQAAMPAMQIVKTGYGAGSSERAIPNVCRIILGEVDLVVKQNEVVIIETNIDDMNPEIYGYLGNLLLENGAKDYYFTPVIMKKGRPGVVITVMVEATEVEKIEAIIFKETSTFGTRRYPVERTCLERNQIEVELDNFTVRVKIGYLDGKILKYAPEYEEALQVARSLNQPLREVYERIGFLVRKILENGGILLNMRN